MYFNNVNIVFVYFVNKIEMILMGMFYLYDIIK